MRAVFQTTRQDTSRHDAKGEDLTTKEVSQSLYRGKHGGKDTDGHASGYPNGAPSPDAFDCTPCHCLSTLSSRVKGTSKSALNVTVADNTLIVQRLKFRPSVINEFVLSNLHARYHAPSLAHAQTCSEPFIEKSGLLSNDDGSHACAMVSLTEIFARLKDPPIPVPTHMEVHKTRFPVRCNSAIPVAI